MTEPEDYSRYVTDEAVQAMKRRVPQLDSYDAQRALAAALPHIVPAIRAEGHEAGMAEASDAWAKRLHKYWEAIGRVKALCDREMLSIDYPENALISVRDIREALDGEKS